MSIQCQKTGKNWRLPHLFLKSVFKKKLLLQQQLHHSILHHRHHPTQLGISSEIIQGVLAEKQSTKDNRPLAYGLFRLYPAHTVVRSPEWSYTTTLSYTTNTILLCLGPLKGCCAHPPFWQNISPFRLTSLCMIVFSLNWYLCYYPHRLRNSVPPKCGIFYCFGPAP